MRTSARQLVARIMFPIASPRLYWTRPALACARAHGTHPEPLPSASGALIPYSARGWASVLAIVPSGPGSSRTSTRALSGRGDCQSATRTIRAERLFSSARELAIERSQAAAAATTPFTDDEKSPASGIVRVVGEGPADAQPAADESARARTSPDAGRLTARVR